MCILCNKRSKCAVLAFSALCTSAGNHTKKLPEHQFGGERTLKQGTLRSKAADKNIPRGGLKVGT